MNSLLHSAKYLAADMASTILFLIVLQITHQVPLAVGCGMALGVIQITWHLVRKEKIDAMQWLSVALVIGSGAATFFTNDPRFVMLKPTVIHVVIGLFMLQRGWMNRYLPEVAQELVPDVAVVFGYIWSGMMFASAALNIVVAMAVDALTWAQIMSVYSLASVAGLFLIQFATMRFIGRRRYARTVEAQPA